MTRTGPSSQVSQAPSCQPPVRQVAWANASRALRLRQVTTQAIMRPRYAPPVREATMPSNSLRVCTSSFL